MGSRLCHDRHALGRAQVLAQHALHVGGAHFLDLLDPFGQIAWIARVVLEPLQQAGAPTFTARAVNSEGSDTENWVVRVVSRFDFDGNGDVSQSDFSHLQKCLSGDTLPAGAGCADADRDGDGDVDAVDVAAFLPCLNGADQIPGC